MILVNNPGSWHDLYPPLAQAGWHGCTPTDLVFPFFLFEGVGSDPRLGTLLFAIANLAAYWALAAWLDRRRIYIKV